MENRTNGQITRRNEQNQNHPHFVVFHSSHKTEVLLDAELTLKSNGSIYQVVPIVMETRCAIDITNFPVDEQTCHFQVKLK